MNCSDSVVLSVFDFIPFFDFDLLYCALVFVILPLHVSFKSVLGESSTSAVNNVTFYLLKSVYLFPVRTFVNSSFGNFMGISDSFVTSDILYLSLAIQSVDCVH